MLPIIEPDWQVPKNIKALMTTVIGGVSVGDCAGLNLGDHVGDNLAHVKKNRQILQKYIGRDVKLCWLNQTHSDIIVDLSDYRGVVEADASVTTEKNIACVVMTADCLPVLLCNQTGTRVAALHCGWKGLYQNLIGKTIGQYFTDEPVTAWLGAAIGQKNYEINETLYQRFTQLNPDYQSAFIGHRSGHYLFDLTDIARQQLQAIGVASQNIFGGNFDTFSDSRFYSYRQSPNTGRMATLIYRCD